MIYGPYAPPLRSPGQLCLQISPGPEGRAHLCALAKLSLGGRATCRRCALLAATSLSASPMHSVKPITRPLAVPWTCSRPLFPPSISNPRQKTPARPKPYPDREHGSKDRALFSWPSEPGPSSQSPQGVSGPKTRSAP